MYMAFRRCTVSHWLSIITKTDDIPSLAVALYCCFRTSNASRCTNYFTYLLQSV